MFFFRNLHSANYLMLFYSRGYVGVIASFSCHCFCSLINITLKTSHDIVGKKAISQLNIHYYHSRW